MRIGGIGEWRGGATIGCLYRIEDQADLDRRGVDSRRRRRPRIGDLVMPVQHAGDCFYEYIVIEQTRTGLLGLPQTRFGAYVMGEPLECLDDRTFHLLAAGQRVTTKPHTRKRIRAKSAPK